jgi:hypothetical protein
MRTMRGWRRAVAGPVVIEHVVEAIFAVGDASMGAARNDWE